MLSVWSNGVVMLILWSTDRHGKSTTSAVCNDGICDWLSMVATKTSSDHFYLLCNERRCTWARSSWQLWYVDVNDTFYNFVRSIAGRNHQLYGQLQETSLMVLWDGTLPTGTQQRISMTDSTTTHFVVLVCPFQNSPCQKILNCCCWMLDSFPLSSSEVALFLDFSISFLRKKENMVLLCWSLTCALWFSSPNHVLDVKITYAS